MFSAFIVDDDRVSVEVTYKLFPWSELSIKQIKKIYTPTGLVDRILSEKPDVVFIDIEMGDVSGLDVVKKCKDAGSSASFVIISGHDNFGYAHTAVNLGALYYLLKPIDKKDIDAVVVKLKAALKISEQDTLSDHLTTANAFNAYLKQHLTGSKHRFIVSFVEEPLYKKMEDLLSSCIASSYLIGKNKHLLLVVDESFNAPLIAQLEQFVQANDVVCAVSEFFAKEDSPYEFFQRANQLSYNRFVSPGGQLLIEPISSDTSVLKDALDSLFQAIDAKRAEAIKQNLSVLPRLFLRQKYTMAHVVWFYNALLGRINIVLNHNFPLSQMDEDDLQTYFPDFEELCAQLYRSVLEAFKPKQIPEKNTNILWEKVLLFIESNYSKKLQAQDICKNLFISERTFYYLFKSNVKVTFVEYLTEFRIKKAKSLLLTTNLSISEVAEKVGIKDHYYFNKVFKKYTGMNPARFKKEEGSLSGEQENKD